MDVRPHLKLRHTLDLILVLTQKEMKVRYKSNVLGYIWSVAQPLCFAFVFFVAFKVVMRIQMEDYTLFLLTGLFPWQWLQNSVNSAPQMLLGNASIIKKVNFPRSIVPMAVVLQDLIHFVLSLPVLVLFIFMYHRRPDATWLVGVPALLVVQFLMAYGIALTLSSINLFFRDLERLVIIFMNFLFYFTPVIYPLSMIPEKYQPLIRLNPVAPLMMAWRSLFMDDRIAAGYLFLSGLYSLVFLAVGFWVYRKLCWRFAEVL